jgi:general secretion pathway protein A
VRAYLARVAPPQLTPIVLWHAPRSFVELLALVAGRFAAPVATDDAAALLAQLQQLLWQESQQGRNVALIIDEAQDLPREILEQLPLLANLIPSREPPLQIVLVGQPALQQHLRRRGLRRVAPRIGIRATIEPLTEAESLAYIRQRVAKVVLPGGPLFTQGALQALVRHARGVPRDVNRLGTTVLQAGYWAQQQPITADLVQQVIAASTGALPFPLGRLGLAAVAGLVLAAGLLWIAPLSVGPQVTGSHPVVRAHAWSEVPRPTSEPLLVAPRLQPPAPTSPPRAESTPGGAVGHDPGAGHARLGALASLENPRLATPPASLTLRVPRTPPATPKGMALKSCDTLKAEIRAKLEAKRLTGYTLTILARGDLEGQQVVGSCEGNTKRIVLNRSRNAQ